VVALPSDQIAPDRGATVSIGSPPPGNGPLWFESGIRPVPQSEKSRHYSPASAPICEALQAHTLVSASDSPARSAPDPSGMSSWALQSCEGIIRRPRTTNQDGGSRSRALGPPSPEMESGCPRKLLETFRALASKVAAGISSSDRTLHRRGGEVQFCHCTARRPHEMLDGPRLRRFPNNEPARTRGAI